MRGEFEGSGEAGVALGPVSSGPDSAQEKPRRSIPRGRGAPQVVEADVRDAGAFSRMPSTPGEPQSGHKPATRLSDGVIHRVRSQIRSIRPLDSAVDHRKAGEELGVPKRFENRSPHPFVGEKVFELHLSARAVNEADAKS